MNHWERINDLFQLKDRRLSSYSDDQTLNIYIKKEFLKLNYQLKNIVRTYIKFFNQLNDGRLCFTENTTKIIKLLRQDDYQI